MCIGRNLYHKEAPHPGLNYSETRTVDVKVLDFWNRAKTEGNTPIYQFIDSSFPSTYFDKNVFNIHKRESTTMALYDRFALNKIQFILYTYFDRNKFV